MATPDPLDQLSLIQNLSVDSHKVEQAEELVKDLIESLSKDERLDPIIQGRLTDRLQAASKALYEASLDIQEELERVEEDLRFTLESGS